MAVWKATDEVFGMVERLKEKDHPRLAAASVAVCFDETKPFVKNKINLGRVSKFSSANKIWQHQKYDFCITIPSDLWQSVLTTNQREAYIDLQLTRCGVEYKPETVEENGKKKPIKDEWGRVQFTDEIAEDKEGNPKWKVLPLDLEVFMSNIGRYNLWIEELTEFGKAVIKAAK